MQVSYPLIEIKKQLNQCYFIIISNQINISLFTYYLYSPSKIENKAYNQNYIKQVDKYPKASKYDGILKSMKNSTKNKTLIIVYI